VRKKLAALGDLPFGPVLDDAVLDASVQYALRRFQSRFGLAATGLLTLSTLRELNRPPEAIVSLLEINLERRRWLPEKLGVKYVLVNIPSFQLQVKDHGQTALSMKVVVGKLYRDTPVFASKIVALVFNPSWAIPAKIILQEKLSEILADPDFFRRKHIEVIAGWGQESRIIDPLQVDWGSVARNDYYELYRFRQDPGPWNALGRIKFLMPNPYDIYLHDTPERALFDETQRDFSHGCIRLEKPLALAEYLLADPRHWNRRRIRLAIQKKVEQTVDLSRPVPVYISYLTICPGDDGLLYFCPDIYSRDPELTAIWDQRAPNPCLSPSQP
jgi:murein L,D-transpeptidase YcbB/YkuD